MRNACLLAFVVLGMTGCAGRGTVYSGRTGADAVAALYDRIGMHGQTPAAVERSLGAPLRTERNAVPNRHGFGTDTAITVVHPAWAHDFLKLGASGDVLLLGMETVDAGVLLPGGLRIGATTREELVSRLGAWESETSVGDTTVVSYRHPTYEAESYVELALRRDTLRLVRWIPYVD